MRPFICAMVKSRVLSGINSSHPSIGILILSVIKPHTDLGWFSHPLLYMDISWELIDPIAHTTLWIVTSTGVHSEMVLYTPLFGGLTFHLMGHIFQNMCHLGSRYFYILNSTIPKTNTNILFADFLHHDFMFIQKHLVCFDMFRVGCWCCIAT